MGLNPVARAVVCFSRVFAFAGVLWLISSEALAAEIKGTVVDPNGHPANGATILISDQSVIRATAVTDRQGRFAIELPVSGNYEVHVALDGFAAKPIAVALTPHTVTVLSITLQVSAVTESIVVTAAGRRLTRSRVTDSVTVITSRDIAVRQFETVSDALRFAVPGLGVTATGGRGGMTSLFTRGGEADFTLVMIDGVRVNDFGGGYDFAHLPVGDIDRIEVVRGPQSAVYGSDAVSGVVQIITKQGGPPRARGVVEGGTYGTSKVSVDTAGSVGDLDWGTAFEQLETNGQNGKTTASGSVVSNDDYLRRDISLKGHWQRSPGTAIHATVRIGTNERGSPGPWGNDPGGTYHGIDTVSRGNNDNRLFSTSVEHQFSPNLDQHVSVSHTHTDSLFVGPYGESISENNRLSLQARTNAVLGSGIVATGGFELQQEDASSSYITDSLFSEVPVERRMIGFFGELRLDPNPQLSVTVGVRGDHIQRNALPGDAIGRPPFVDETEVATSPKISIGWYPRPPGKTPDWTRVRVSVGTGLRPPSAFEIAFTDNPALKSERTRSVDFGVEQALVSGNILMGATTFFNRYDDLIVSVGQSFKNTSQFRTDNLSNSRASGIELAVSGRTTRGFEARATYTWMHTEVLGLDATFGQAPGPFTVGDPLLRRPRHQGALEVSYIEPRFSAFTSIGTRSRTLDVDPSLGAFGGLFDNPGYGLVNAGGSVRTWTRLEFVVRVQNLLDRNHEEVLGFPGLGRSFIAGIRVATC